MNVRGTCVGKTPESIQSSQPLGECPCTTCLCHEVLRVNVGPHFQGLRRYHDQVTLAHRSRWPGRCHPLFRVENPCTDPFRLAFAHEPGKK